MLCEGVLFPGWCFCSLWQSRRESFTLKLNAHQKHCHCVYLKCCCLLQSVLDTVRLALPVFAFLFVIAILLILFVRLSHFRSFCPTLAFSFVALFPSTALSCSLSLSVCLSKRQISSLGETLEDSPSVYK